MGASELLRLVVDADVQGAVSGLKKVGDTTQRELGRSQATIDKWGAGFSKAGVGLMAAGGGLLVGLGAMAKRSEEANLSTVKLQNSLSANPRLAGTSAKGFIDLAQAIQGKTAADGDDIVAGMAVLAQGKLQARQIKELTPLVVDLARKKGIDEVSAFTLASKAVAGNAGALKRAGIQVDETKFKTDAYGATVSALKTSVGGFATQEGKTFAGSLQRMKNQLGDLEEGVGAGAVDAFTSLFSVVGKTSTELNKISPGAQAAVGKIATFAGVGLLAAGGLSTLIGQAIKARQNFKDLASGISTLINKMGGLGSAAGLAVGAAGIGALALEAKHLNDQANKFDASGIADALTSVSHSADPALRDMIKLADASGELNNWFGKLLDTSVPAAERFIEMAKSMGISHDKIKELQKAVEEKKQADIGASKSQSDYNAAVQQGTETLDANKSSTEQATEALQKYHDKMQALFDPLFGLQDAYAQNAKAQQDVAAKQLELIAAENVYQGALKRHGPNSKEAKAASLDLMGAQQALTAANQEATRSAFGVDSAIADMRVEIQKNPAALDQAKKKLEQWTAQGLITKAQAAQTGREFDVLAGKVRGVPGAKAIHVTTSGVKAAQVAIQKVKDTVLSTPGYKSVTIDLHVTGAAAVQRAESKLLGPGHAGGGSVRKGVPYPVGERGMEIFVPDQNGTIIPHDKIGAVSGGGMAGGSYVDNRVFNISITKSDPKAVFAELQQHMKNTGPLRLKVRGGL